MGPGVPLPKTLSEFCEASYWNAFFEARGDRPFEWYVEWKHISKIVVGQCGLKTKSEKILIPGCGNSTLSADIYDAGFTQITNIDFSRVVITQMLREHGRIRPQMRWLVMDMTQMRLSDGAFDVVLDKGGLDALLGEPEEDSSSGVLFLSEVKRVLNENGVFVCITLAQQHVIEVLLSTFREGWHLSVHGLQVSSADAPSSWQPFIVIAKRESRHALCLVSFDLDLGWRGTSNKLQMQAVVESVDAENALRSQGSTDSRVSLPSYVNPEDCFEILRPGRRLTMKLGCNNSLFTYLAVIMDAKEDMKPETRCAVFLVPTGRSHEWLFSSEEGQWEVAVGTKAARLILVILDSIYNIDNIIDLKDNLSPLVKCLLPLDCREGGHVPYLTQGDEIKSRNILDRVVSPMTGDMLVEDVVLSEEITSSSKSGGPKDQCFRRLVFKRNPNLIQSEALLIRDKGKHTGETIRKNGQRKKKGSKKVSGMAKPGVVEDVKVDFSYLASPYHEGMIAGLILIANNLEQWLASKEQIRLMLIGLGAGLLPMFVHNHLPIDEIQIVELDPVVADVARRYFGFIEDERMKFCEVLGGHWSEEDMQWLCIGDGIAAVQAIASATPSCSQDGVQDRLHDLKEITSGIELSSLSSQSKKDESLVMEGSGLVNRNRSNEATSTNSRFHVLIIDADSEDPRSGLSCPPPDFLEVPFLLAAKEALVDGGMLVINVVSRAKEHHVQIVARLKVHFEEVYDIEVREDVNRVLIALPQARNGGVHSDIKKDLLKFKKMATEFSSWGNGPDLKEFLKDLKRLK